MSIKETDQTFVAGTYTRFPVEIAGGKGSKVWDTGGKEYIDLGSGIGVTAFGIADDDWRQAVAAQLGLVQHTSNLYYTEPCAELARLLCEKTGMKKVFFSNSGAEANECAVKVARKYAAQTKGAEYYHIVTLKNSFHGRTLTTLAATGQEHFHQLFQPLTPGFITMETKNPFELDAIAARKKIAAVMIECVQGEGGVIPLEKEFVKQVEAFTRRKDILLIVDEVQTGNGRTGALYSYMHYGVKPDIVSTAKGLSGGLPIGATLLGERVQNVLGPGEHGSTFGGNPVCCAAALNVLSRIDDQLLREVSEKGAYIKEELQNTKGIENVSGMGLMLGFKPAAISSSEFVRRLIEKGVLCLTAKEKVRLLPALNIPRNLLETAVEAIKQTAKEQGI